MICLDTRLLLQILIRWVTVAADACLVEWNFLSACMNDQSGHGLLPCRSLGNPPHSIFKEIVIKLNLLKQLISFFLSFFLDLSMISNMVPFEKLTSNVFIQTSQFSIFIGFKWRSPCNHVFSPSVEENSLQRAPSKQDLFLNWSKIGFGTLIVWLSRVCPIVGYVRCIRGRKSH